MNYRNRELVEVLHFDAATDEELTAWNLTGDPTMAGMIAIRAVGSVMVKRIMDETTFSAQYEPIP